MSIIAFLWLYGSSQPNCFVVEVSLFCERDDETWLTMIVELSLLNQEVSCKFMFITPFPLYL